MTKADIDRFVDSWTLFREHVPKTYRPRVLAEYLWLAWCWGFSQEDFADVKECGEDWWEGGPEWPEVEEAYDLFVKSLEQNTEEAVEKHKEFYWGDE